MEWFVQLTGENIDLEELSKSLHTPEFCITQEGQAFILKSTYFNCLETAEDVRKKAADILSLVNGGASLTLGTRQPLGIAHVVRVNDDGTRKTFVDLSGEVNIRGIPSMLAIAQDGTVREIRPWDVIPSWLLAAQRSESVAKVLRLFGTSSHDWVALYRIYEIIEADVRGVSEIEKRGWATKKSIKRFKHTANSPAVIGDDSRHGVERSTPPKDPMLPTEAKSLIEGIVLNWLRSKT